MRRFLLLLLGALAACSRLPSYARPQGELMDPNSIDEADLIEYRTLTPADFRGEKPGGEAAHHMDAMGAETHVIVRPDPSLQIIITETGGAKGGTRYSGKLGSVLHFRAQMDRKRSWWNPNLKAVPEAYVLQHEQIHFAIAVVEARNLNARAAALTAEMHAEGASPDEVKGVIQAKLNDVIRGALDRLIERSGKFDEDTSARYVPKKQDEWWRLLRSELREKPE